MNTATTTAAEIFVLRLTHREGRTVLDSPVEIDYEGRDVCYLHKSVSRDRRHGWIVSKVTSEISQARTWATRAGAEQYLATHFTYDGPSGSYSYFTVEEVVD